MLFNMCQKAESLEYLYFDMHAFFVHPLFGFDRQSLSYFVIGSAFLLFSGKLCPHPPPPNPPTFAVLRKNVHGAQVSWLILLSFFLFPFFGETVSMPAV